MWWHRSIALHRRDQRHLIASHLDHSSHLQSALDESAQNLAATNERIAAQAEAMNAKLAEAVVDEADADEMDRKIDSWERNGEKGKIAHREDGIDECDEGTDHSEFT